MEKISVDIGGFSRPIAGEKKNGDALFITEENGFHFFAIIDGIGHGDIAYEISHKIKGFLQENVSSNISYLIEKTHKYMTGSEGAALGIGVIMDKILYFGSLGNISCKIVNAENINLVSTDGLLGVRGRSVKVTSKILENNDAIMIYSDGIDSSFSNSEFKNYHLFSSEILAKKIVQQWGSMFDDASIITVKIKM